jgi:serine/threonine protein kinase
MTMSFRQRLHDIKRELEILRHLSGQSNIQELLYAYEDNHSFLQACHGAFFFGMGIWTSST